MGAFKSIKNGLRNTVCIRIEDWMSWYKCILIDPARTRGGQRLKTYWPRSLSTLLYAVANPNIYTLHCSETADYFIKPLNFWPHRVCATGDRWTRTLAHLPAPVMCISIVVWCALYQPILGFCLICTDFFFQSDALEITCAHLRLCEYPYFRPADTS